jgi:4-diphosphocytidyl-2-C-methyl-D-erythritol kinase
VVFFPNCKLNLGLNIIRKRADGYHDVETVFYPISLCDAIEIIDAGNFQFSTSGETIHGEQQDNLCIKAYQLLKKDFPQLPAIRMHLHKHIPSGAGLGGGSADAAFTLKLCDRKFGLRLSNEKLIEYALQLGSDCPFFIINKPCFATGRGECLETIDLDISDHKFLVVNPRIHISTAEAFSLITPQQPSRSIKEIIHQPMETWKSELKNNFEEFIFKKYPEIKKIKEDLYAAGAVYSSMSGSGSTVYGIFRKENNLQVEFPENYFVKELPRKS